MGFFGEVNKERATRKVQASVFFLGIVGTPDEEIADRALCS